MQINAVIIESYAAFKVSWLFCTDSVKNLYRIKNIHRFALIFSTKNYLLFLFEDILQIFVK